MNRRFLIAFTLSLSMLAGCATATSPTPPLAPGYFNTADETMGKVLSGARAFYRTIQCETQTMNWAKATDSCVADPTITSPMVLTPTEKTAFNTFQISLNVGNQVYLAYHAGTATQAAAQAAVNTVKTQQEALPVPAVK